MKIPYEKPAKSFFQNPGEQLKLVGKGITALGLAVSVIGLIITMMQITNLGYEMRTQIFLIAIAVAIGVVLAFYVFGLVVYGFGELICHARDVRNNLCGQTPPAREAEEEEPKVNLYTPPTTLSVSAPEDVGERCGWCGETLQGDRCEHCGYQKENG